MHRFAPLFVLLPLTLHAATFDAPNVPLENDTPNNEPKLFAPSLQQPENIQAAKPSTNTTTPTLNEADLLANPALIETLINQAIQGKDAVFLADLLVVYRRLPEKDETLLDYAQSAVWHMQGKYGAAIALQEKLLAKQDNAHYIRLNTAMMQLADKRYGDAADNFRILAEQNEIPALQDMATQYAQQLQTMRQWQFGGYLQYDHNKNVNNASDERGITINGTYWQKSADSLPKSADGVRYGLSASRLLPLSGNHAMQFSGSLNGRHYWDNHQYSRHSIYAAVAHLYQNHDWTLRTTPFASQTWLAGKPYAHDIGLNHTITYRLNPNWRIQLSPSLRRTNYHEEANHDFNNTTFSLTPMVLYNKDHFQTHWGVHYAHNNATKASLSSQTWQLRGGIEKVWQPYVGISLDVAYGKERYERAPELRFTPYPFRRSDTTLQTDVSLWQPNWHYKGLMPKLNFSAYLIKSNMPAFYSRKDKQVYLSVEKVF